MWYLCSIARVKDAVEIAEHVAFTSIRSFTGENEFLSTLHKCRVVIPNEGVSEDDYVPYGSAEHALQVRNATGSMHHNLGVIPSH